MKQRLSVLSLAVIGALGLSIDPALVHSEDETTTPTDGAVPETAPDAIGLTFDQPMRRTMIPVTDDEGVEYDIKRTDGMAPVTEFEATPAALVSGAYTVEWRGLSADGHPMDGRYSFEIGR